MTERQRNRAVLATEATAEPTRDSDGNPTVTAVAVFHNGDAWTERQTMHLSYPAALSLLEDLREALAL